MAFRIQKLRFVYKYSVVDLQYCVSVYKVASRISIKVSYTHGQILCHISTEKCINLHLFVLN